MKGLKKLIAIFMVMTMTVGLLAGCSEGKGNAGGNNATGGSQTGSNSDGTQTEAKKVKMGIIIWGTSDALGRNSTMMVEKLVKLTGGEVVVDTNATSPETQIQSAENLIAAGCNAIVIVNYSDTMLPKLGQICEENEVYWGLMWRDVISDEVAQVVNNYKYFVGNTREDEIEIAKRLAYRLADAGVTECGVITSAVGDTTHDMRNEGYDQVCAETSLKRTVESRGDQNAADTMESVEKFLIGYPNLEAIYITGGTSSKLEGALSALDKHNKRGKIKLAVIDFIDADLMKEYLNDGTLFAIAGGHYVDPVFTAAMLVNAVQGNKLSDKPEEIVLPFVDFQSAEDAENYYKYVENDAEKIYAYNDDELKSMLKIFNPDVTVDYLRELAAKYSIDDVMERHGNK